MSTENGSKINQLLKSVPSGVVLSSAWLDTQGYNLDLQKKYRKGLWLESIGSGAMRRVGDEISIEGGMYALQEQLGLSVHIGGRSSFSLLGKSHYLQLGQQEVTLFGVVNEKLPKWFTAYPWEKKLKYHQSNFLSPELNMVEFEVKDFKIKISGPLRSMMECIYLAPKEQSLMECYELMEGLNNLSPVAVHRMLAICKSVKVKRLFLYLAEKADHGWFRHLDLTGIDLGKGKRSIVPDGVYVPKYGITVPKELETNESGI